MEFEIDYYDSAVHRFNHYTTRTPPPKLTLSIIRYKYKCSQMFRETQEMKEAVTKVIDTLTQEDFHGAFQKLLERYNKCIATGGDYFEGD